MDIIDFYRLEQKRIHDWMRRGISDLTTEEWNHTIEGSGNNIAFLVWHCARTEDNILRFILQGRPTFWGEGNWHGRLGLQFRGQGTGMATEAARAFRIADARVFRGDVADVVRDFRAELAGVYAG